MPIYEYACSACGHQMEIMQSIKDDPLTQCPKCKKKELRKLVSAAGFQLKGTGWYVTDFRDKAKTKEGSKPAAESSASTEKKTDDASKTSAVATEGKKNSDKSGKKKPVD